MVKSFDGNRQNAIVNFAAFVIVIAGMKAASPLIVPISSGTFFPYAVSILLTLLLAIWGSTLQDFTCNIPAYRCGQTKNSLG